MWSAFFVEGGSQGHARDETCMWCHIILEEAHFSVQWSVHFEHELLFVTFLGKTALALLEISSWTRGPRGLGLSPYQCICQSMNCPHRSQQQTNNELPNSQFHNWKNHTYYISSSLSRPIDPYLCNWPAISKMGSPLTSLPPSNSQAPHAIVPATLPGGRWGWILDLGQICQTNVVVCWSSLLRKWTTLQVFWKDT